MGLDFILRARANVRKGWANGKSELARLDLFSRTPSSEPRIFTFQPLDGSKLSCGASILLAVDGDKLVGYVENAPVVVAINPPIDLLDSIRCSANCALGVVASRHELSGVLDVVIQ